MVARRSVKDTLQFAAVQCQLAPEKGQISRAFQARAKPELIGLRRC